LAFPGDTGPANTRQRLREAILRHIRYSLGRASSTLSPPRLLKPVSLAVRELLIDGMLETDDRYRRADAKRLYYLSMEFLIGRALSDNLCNLKLTESCREVLAELQVRLEPVLDSELDAGLGNGGLGRLAACFLESLATLDMPGFGYGIDYEYGLFRQEIEDGWQREHPDRWKAAGVPLYVEHAEEPFLIPVYGRVEQTLDSQGNYKRFWVDYNAVIGRASDLPVAGYGGKTVNWLRLFSAHSSEGFNLDSFNQGDYIRAVEREIATENISRVLYPSDSVSAGKELRLLQEYFLVACSIKDILRHYELDHSNIDEFPSKVAIQMNDTHPSLAVAELMRVLLDTHELDWDRAWEITEATLGYTNHTLMPEALERWSVGLLERVLPRHMQIIYQINQKFLQTVERSWPGDLDRQRRMSIIEETYEKQVRMANLAMIGSHAVNGVSELHSQLLKTSLAADFAELWPQKFSNKTNGVAPRRWLLKANPPLSDLLTRTIGDEWITDLNRLRELEQHAGNPEFQSRFMAAKRQNKEQLAQRVYDAVRVRVDPASIFDVHVKRIHEYKRQLLNVMRIIHEYLRIAEDGGDVRAPRTYIFAGKAAPSYWAAKQVIKLIHNVGKVVNQDTRVRDRMKVVFLPDYRVSLAEAIMPAADLSEQISTAGLEASGTGNMKLAMNGALTIGTLDGANIELMREVGADNIYIFGLTAEEIANMRDKGTYHPRSLYNREPRLARVLDALSSSMFSPEQPGLFGWIYNAILDMGDRYMHLPDLLPYVDASARAEQDYITPAVWARKAILNVARSGKFSSDRTIREYARDVWTLEPVAPDETLPNVGADDAIGPVDRPM